MTPTPLELSGYITHVATIELYFCYILTLNKRSDSWTINVKNNNLTRPAMLSRVLGVAWFCNGDIVL